MNLDFTLSLIINVVAVAFFAGVLKQTQSDQKETIKNMQKNFKDTIELVRSEFQAHFDRLEKKQDKHNNLIERMVVVEQSTKSAHHRIDDLEVKQ